jgi:two-component system, chemotaxis family, sensor histidine kinase and response regulator PixL
MQDQSREHQDRARDSKEQEVRLQFLDEAQTYLDRIEDSLLGISTNELDRSKLDEILRAAHSIKGGAAMMGFMPLSEIAHRLEDFFKVLRGKSCDRVVEQLFLQSIDDLRQVVNYHRQGKEISQAWLESKTSSVLSELHARLGDPQPEDEIANLSIEAGEDMRVMLFESEVESCLSRLEEVLANPSQPCLKEEFLIASQELGCLGEMLELPNFKLLCDRITESLEINSDLVYTATNALQAWRRSQALVIIGQYGALPSELDKPTETLAIQPSEIKPSILPLDLDSIQIESTIRVSQKQLTQLGEQFSQLTTERSGLNFQLRRMRELVTNLSDRVLTLEAVNSRLRTSYDQVATQSVLTSNTQSNNLQLNSLNKFSGESSSESQGFDLLEMDRYGDLHFLSQEIMENVALIQELSGDIETALTETESASRELSRTSKQMEVGMTKVRMRPLSDVVSRFRRTLRDMSLSYGKSVELKVNGGNTLIERSVIELLNDPLIQIIRNAFDHGIEDSATRIAHGKTSSGTISINAGYRGNQTLITISDDGAGIDLEKLRQKAPIFGISPTDIADANKSELLELIFEPGFSTVDKVTELSGRGVGMDVVRTNLISIGGSVTVDTTLGRGTTFTLTVPFSLSVTRVLLVESNKMILAFPANEVEEMVLLSELEKELGKTITWEEEEVPLVNLSQFLQFSRPHRPIAQENLPTIEQAVALIVAKDDAPYAIAVDRYWGEAEVTTRPIAGNIKLPPGLLSCALLGDGRVVPILESEDLLNWILAENYTPSVSNAPTENRRTVMVVDDSVNVRRFLALTLEKEGYLVEQAKDGVEAMEKLNANSEIQGIICDVEMPRLDGFGFLAQKGSSKFKSLPIMMLTSRSGQKHRQLAMNLGADAYFTKPFRELELLEMLRSLIKPGAT